MVEPVNFDVIGKQIASNSEPTALVEYVRQLLLETTFNSVAENQVPELVVRAVNTGLWTNERAIKLVGHITDEQRKVQMCIALLTFTDLAEAQRQYLETTIIDTISIDEPYAKSSQMHSLLKILQSHTLRADQHDRVLNRALTLALELDTGESIYWDSPRALWSLALHLTGEPLARAVENIPNITKFETRAWDCAGLARQLSGEQRTTVLQYGVDAALANEDELLRANALAQLGEQLTGDLLERALQATFALKDEQWRPRVIEKLASQLNEPQLRAAFEESLGIQHPWLRTYALMGLLPYLTEDLSDQALGAIFSVTTESNEAIALVVSRLRFGEDTAARFLDIALTLKDESYRFKALVSLIPQLEGEQKQKALDNALNLVETQFISETSAYTQLHYYMIQLAEHLEKGPQLRLISDTLDMVLKISYEEERGYALQVLFEHLPETLMPRALEAVLVFEEDFRRNYVLGSMAAHLPEALLQRAMMGSSRVYDYDDQANALIALSHVLSEPDKQKALRFAQRAIFEIQDLWERVESRTRLLAELDETERADVAAKALEMALSLPNSDQKVNTLMALLPYLETLQQDEVFAVAREIAMKIVKPNECSRALVALAIHTESAKKDELLALALEKAMSTPEDKIENVPGSELLLRTAALAHVAKHLTGALLTQALVYLQQYHLRFWQIQLILECPFTRSQFETTLLIVEQISDDGCRAEALAELAQQASPEEKARMQNRALAQAKIETNAHRCFSILILLAKQFYGEQQIEVLDLALAAIGEMDTKVTFPPMFELLSFDHNKDKLLLEIRMAIVKDLESQRSKPREDLLRSFDAPSFTPPIFPNSIVTAIIDEIIAVCWAN